MRNFVERERAAKKEKLGGWGGEFIPIFTHLCISTFQRLCNLQADPFSYKTHLLVLPGSSTHGFRIYLLVFPPLRHYLFLIRIFSFVFTCITVSIILLIYFFCITSDTICLYHLCKFFAINFIHSALSSNCAGSFFSIAVNRFISSSLRHFSPDLVQHL